MLYLNYKNRTYRWNYSHGVEVIMYGQVTDHFSIGSFANNDACYEEFIEGVVAWSDYLDYE